MYQMGLTRPEAKLFLENFPRECEDKWQAYQVQFEKNIALIIKSLIIDRKVQGKPYDLSNGESLIGMFFRFDKCNARASVMMKKIEKILGAAASEVKFIQYFDTKTDNENSLVEDYIKQNNPDNKPYVLWATNAARMGVSFPKHCRYFLELSNGEKVLAASALQGTSGRATGYFKRTAVFLSRTFAAKMIELYNTGKWYGEFHSRAKYQKGATAVSGTVHIRDYKKHPIIMSALREIKNDRTVHWNKWWDKNGEKHWISSNGELYKVGKKYGPGESERSPLEADKKYDSAKLWPIFNPLIDELEKYPELVCHGVNSGKFTSVSFVRYYPKDLDNPKCYAQYDQQKKKISAGIGHRLTDSPANMGDRNHDRNSNVNRSANSENDVGQMVHVTLYYRLTAPKTKNSYPKLTITKIQIPFNAVHRGESGVLLPTDDSMFHGETLRKSGEQYAC